MIVGIFDYSNKNMSHVCRHLSFLKSTDSLSDRHDKVGIELPNIQIEATRILKAVQHFSDMYSCQKTIQLNFNLARCEKGDNHVPLPRYKRAGCDSGRDIRNSALKTDRLVKMDSDLNNVLLQTSFKSDSVRLYRKCGKPADSHLISAVRFDCREVLCHILNSLSGVEPAVLNDCLWTSVRCGVKRSAEEILKQIDNRSAWRDIARHDNGDILLHPAAAQGDAELIQLLMYFIPLSWKQEGYEMRRNRDDKTAFGLGLHNRHWIFSLKAGYNGNVFTELFKQQHGEKHPLNKSDLRGMIALLHMEGYSVMHSVNGTSPLGHYVAHPDIYSFGTLKLFFSLGATVSFHELVIALMNKNLSAICGMLQLTHKLRCNGRGYLHTKRYM